MNPTTNGASRAQIELDKLEALARAADPDGVTHLVTHYRDHANVETEEAWRRAATPAAVLELIALARAGQQAGEAAQDDMPPLPAGDEAGMFSGACIVYTGGEMRAYGEACARVAWNNCASLNQPLIADLRAQLATLRDWMQRPLKAVYDENADLRAQLASAQRDSDRYEWIIENCTSQGGGQGFAVTFHVPFDEEDIGCGIDKARAQLSNTTETDVHPCYSCGSYECNGQCMGE